nr:hypothetical protein [Tanacetum cinerariifolium]
MTSITSLCEMACQVVQKKLEEKQLEEERSAKAQNLKLPVCYDDDDDEERSDFLDDNIISGLPPFSAITPDEPVLSIEEPDNSLSMGDEHLDTIPATESDEFIKSSVETLISIPTVEDEPTSSQFPKSYLDPEGDMLLFEAFLNDDHSSDFKTKSSSTSLNSLLEETNNFDNSLAEFTTFSKVLCDVKYESDSSDDQSCSDEDVLEKIVLKPLDILILKDFPSNNTLSFAEKESFHFDIPPFSQPPAKPPDGDIGIFNIKMMGDIFDQKAFMHKLMITLASHQEKSPDLLSHRCGTVKKFNTPRSHLNECPMMIHGQNNPPLDVLMFHFYPP